MERHSTTHWPACFTCVHSPFVLHSLEHCSACMVITGGDLTVSIFQPTLFQPVTSLLKIFKVSPELQGEVQTISSSIQGSHLPFQSYLSFPFSCCPKLSTPLALTPSLCISLLHLSMSCSSSHTHGPCSELSGRSCVFHTSSLCSLPCSFISLMPAQSLPGD